MKDYDELKRLLDRMPSDEKFLHETCIERREYVTDNAGATNKIMSMINF